MSKEELSDIVSQDQNFIQKYFGLTIFKFLVFVIIIVLFGIYIGILLYGDSSVEVLFQLQDYENYLHTEIKHLKSENAQLQREYFELKEISAQD